MRRLTIILTGVLMLLSSCERRPLFDLFNTHYVRVYIDEHLLNVTTGFYNPDHQKPAYSSPSIIRVALTDPDTGVVKAERYLRNMDRDERGTYYDGYIIADPGRYHMIAYNFDTEATIISGANSHLSMEAYTNEIASHLYSKIPSRVKAPVPNERIVYEPDHLFVVDCGDVIVNYVEQPIGSSICLPTPPATCADSWISCAPRWRSLSSTTIGSTTSANYADARFVAISSRRCSVVTQSFSSPTEVCSAARWKPSKRSSCKTRSRNSCSRRSVSRM